MQALHLLPAQATNSHLCAKSMPPPWTEGHVTLETAPMHRGHLWDEGQGHNWTGATLKVLCDWAPLCPGEAWRCQGPHPFCREGPLGAGWKSSPDRSLQGAAATEAQRPPTATESHQDDP